MRFITTLSTILMLLVYSLEVLSIIPYFAGKHIVFLFWILITFITYKSQALEVLSQKKYKWIFVFLVYYFIASTFATSVPTAFARIIAFFELISPVYMYDLYKVDKWGGKHYPLVFMFVMVLINMIIAYQMIDYLGYNGLRDTIQGDSDNKLKGSFHLIYSLAILAPSMIAPFVSNKQIVRGSKTTMLLIVVFILFSLYLIFKAMFTTAIVVALFGFILFIFYGRKHWIVKTALVSLVLPALFLANFNTILTTVNTLSDSAPIMTARLYEMKSIVEGNEGEASDFSSRKDLTSKSFDTFLHNPLFGVCSKVSSFDTREKNGIGNHNEWVDSLALYGIFSLCLFIFLILSVKALRSDGISIVHSLLFLIIGYTNPVLSFMTISVVFLIIPVYYDQIGLNNEIIYD